MKKLLFTFVGAAAFAALANDPEKRNGDIDVLGFENFDLQAEGVTGEVVQRGDDGLPNEQSKWSCTNGTDASFVKTYGDDNVAKGNGRSFPLPFGDEGNQYLELNTEGSELQRAINQSIGSDGMYIDTLVQFTPTEDANPPDVTNAKLAIWLGVDSTGAEPVTNLYVMGAYYDSSDGEALTVEQTKAYKLNKYCAPNTWYRLTVKAYSTIGNAAAVSDSINLPAFSILIDGEEIATSDAVYSQAGLEYLCPGEGSGSEDDNYLDAAMLTAFKAGKIIPSCDLSRAPATLTSVGFKGSGALDDFVVTTNEPENFGPAGIDFTLTWPAGLTAVSYTIDGGEPVAISGASPLSIPNLVGGEAITFIVQNADGVQKTLTATAADGEGIDATGTTFGWAEYLGEAVNGAYEIDNLAELKLFQKGIAITTNELKLATAGETFKLTADIALDAAWPGIGVQNGKDIYSTADFNAAAFQGTFDGQNHTISGFQMIGKGDKAEGLDYCGFFNSAYGATIQNLKIAYAGSLFAADTTASTKESGATFVGVAKNSTLRNLTTVAGTVSCSKGFGGIVGYLTSGTLVDSCTNNVNMTSLAPNKCGGIAMITQNGSAVTIINCQNNGSVAGSGEIGSAIGYIGLDTTISNFESTVAYKMFQHQGNTVTLQGTIKGNATVDSYTGQATPGLNFATVDGSVATFVADEALAAGNIYKVMHTATATYEFAEAGSISFDTNLIQAVTFAITAAQGLDAPTETTENGVVTFTVAAAGGDDYEVSIDGSDVVITPSAEDLAAVQAAVIAGGGTLDVTDVAAVNAALAAPIGTTGIPSWQALFLGVAPTEAGLETVAIKSVSFDADGKVVVEMADGVELKTGRGVDIKLKLMGSSDLTNWTQIGSDITNTKTIPAITPGSGETKKFYKVVVDFAGSSN